MATTFINFTPVATGTPFQFNATLDGSLYTVIVTWQLYGQRWYISIYDINSALVLYRPMTGSPPLLPLAPPPQSEVVNSMTWSPINGGQVAFVMGEDSIFVLGDVIQVQEATNSGTGGDSIVNGQFEINTWQDPKHFTVLLNAESGVVGTIGGSPILILEESALAWSNETGVGLVTATTDAPHGLDLGAPTSLRISGATPDGYNGRYLCLPTSPVEFTFPLGVDPGLNIVPGSYGPDISLVDGYFTSELIWRPSDGRFEVVS